MKVIVILCLLVVGLADPDYANPTSAGDFSTPQCQNGNNAFSFSESPITISNQTCVTYNSFAISMSDTDSSAINFNSTTGALTKAYTSASLTINGSVYTSTQLSFRVDSEHIVPPNTKRSAAEIQIELTGPSTNGIPGTVVLSFLVEVADANPIAKSSNYNKILTDFSQANALIHFGTLAQYITDNIANTVFLNIYTYNGTLTYGTCAPATWFIYGQLLYATQAQIDALKTAITTGLTTGTSRVGAAPNLNSRALNTLAVPTYRLCYTGFFEVVLGYNYGLWFGVTSILLFFIFTLTLGDHPIRDRDYQEDVWTHHPIVSVYKYGNEIHTRKSRVALILCMITVHALFSSVFYRDATDKTKGSNVILFAVYSMLIDWVVSYFLARILRSYYLAKYQLHKTRDENWDQRAQNRLFGYYISVFAIVVVGWAFTVWNMGELHPESTQDASRLWVASLFIGLALEFLIVTPIVCLIAGSVDMVKNLVKSQGFMYDNICHETYMEYLKQD